MEDIKQALKNLEKSVLKLEESIHESKKARRQCAEATAELQQVIKTAYDRLDKALQQVKQGGE